MLKVKVFSDFACPYCYLGLCLLEKLREDGIEYEAEWMPFGTVNIFSQIKLAAWLVVITWQRNLIAQFPFFQGVSYSDTFYSPIECQQHV